MRVQKTLGGRATTAFDHQDRFIARGTTGRRNKASGIAQMLKIEQDGTGFGIACQKIQQLVDIDVQPIAQGDKVGEPHLTLLCPVEDRIGDRRRLRDKGQLAFTYRNRRETGVQPLPGRQQAKAVWPQQSHLESRRAGQKRRLLFRR